MAQSLLLCSGYSGFLALNPTASPLLPLPIPRACSRGGRGSSSFSGSSGSVGHHSWLAMGGRSRGIVLCRQTLRRGLSLCMAQKTGGGSEEQRGREDGRRARRAQQAALWTAEAAYILWLFLLPYAPGDPVWAIKSNTINDIVSLSLNFFFVLPLLNFIGIHVIEAPLLHPMSEGLFNFVIGWTVLFAPLLFTDCQRDRYKGSLDILWGFQMFLTNTFLIPYMAIRLNDVDLASSRPKQTQLGLLMTDGAPIVGTVGGVVCLFSIFWAFFGRPDAGFGGIADRWEFLECYVASERLAYAFVWDICLYAIFQPWLIGDNLQNVKKNDERVVSNLRFIPVVGLVAYLLCIDDEKEI